MLKKKSHRWTEPRTAAPRSVPLKLRLAVVFGLLVVGCTNPGSGVSAPANGEASTTLVENSTTVRKPKVVPQVVLETVAGLSTEQKIGQIFMPVFNGVNARDLTADQLALNETEHGYGTPAQLVESYKLGGIIYLEDNIASATQVKQLSADLQEVARRNDGLELLISVDQEGGRVSRITDRVSPVPPAIQYDNDPAKVELDSYAKGQQIKDQGINVVLAPVADVVSVGQSSIGDRSFGSDPEKVSELTRSAVRGLQLSGVAAAAKHWPGHGSTSVDSHDSLPTINLNEQTWRTRDRLPFVAAVEENVAVVLVGHLALPELDPTANPATVSPVLVDGLLRQELGFEGVIMSDALNMGAVENRDQGQLAVQAFQAGIDILLVPTSLSVAHAAVSDAVTNGTISMAQLDASVTRILTLKYELGLLPAQP